MSTTVQSFVLPVRSADPTAMFGESEFTYVDISSVDRDRLEVVSPQVLTPDLAPSRARQVLAAGDVVVSTVRPNLNTVAQVSGSLDGAIASTGFCVLRPDQERLDKRFLFHWISSESTVRRLVQQATGATYPAVSDKVIKSLPFNPPKLAEQQRIAAILDKADSLRRKRQEAIRLADTLRRSVFVQMFGDPDLNPKAWPILPMGDVIEFKGGSQPPKETFVSEPRPGYVRLVQIRDFKTDKYKTYIPEQLAKRSFDEDDVMVARYGPPVFQILRGLSGSYNVALMKAQPKPNVLKEFVFWLLQLPKYQSAVVSNSERTAGQTGVNLDFLNALDVPLPPLAFQQEIASAMVKISSTVEKQQAMLEESEKLLASLQSQYFDSRELV